MWFSILSRIVARLMFYPLPCNSFAIETPVYGQDFPFYPYLHVQYVNVHDCLYIKFTES